LVHGLLLATFTVKDTGQLRWQICKTKTLACPVAVRQKPRVRQWELLRKRHYSGTLPQGGGRKRPTLSWTDNIHSWTGLGLVEVLRIDENSA